MSVYLDANVIVRHNLDVLREETEPLMLLAVETAPLPITTLMLCELRNAMARMVYESRNGAMFRVSSEAAMAAQAEFEQDLAHGVLFSLRPVSLEAIRPRFELIADRHTARHGFRTYNVLHVASALHLGCGRFFSFDKRAVELARLEGLETN